MRVRKAMAAKSWYAPAEVGVENHKTELLRGCLLHDIVMQYDRGHSYTHFCLVGSSGGGQASSWPLRHSQNTTGSSVARWAGEQQSGYFMR